MAERSMSALMKWQRAGGQRAGTAYALSGAALIAAIVLRWLLDPIMRDALPLVTLFGAVAFASWVGGHRPAAIVAIFGYVACAYLFIQPRGNFLLGGVGDVVGLSAYAVTWSLIIGSGGVVGRVQ